MTSKDSYVSKSFNVAAGTYFVVIENEDAGVASGVVASVLGSKATLYKHTDSTWAAFQIPRSRDTAEAISEILSTESF